LSRSQSLAQQIGRCWPGSALASWGLAWLLASVAGWTAGCLLALALGLLHRRPWRRVCVALGLPLALMALGLAVPAWLWLLAALALLLLYPLHLWRDAPLFLTPPDAIMALPALLPLPPGARLLDAGCGSGAGLRAWRRAYPQLRFLGTEASWPLALWSRLRCPWAQVRRGDLWRDAWGDFDVVYLFQRPESMPAALAKAQAELTGQAWLVSLDFELPGKHPQWRLPTGRHELLVYAREDLN
jgi:hypothetical protein